MEPTIYEVAQNVIDRLCKSYVESALALARHVVTEREHRAKLQDDIATLKLLIEGIARATPDDRAGVIAAALELSSKMR